jgi:hypothetical protein
MNILGQDAQKRNLLFSNLIKIIEQKIIEKKVVLSRYTVRNLNVLLK